MRNIKILHVASFVGNIGDNASHMGLYSILNKLIGENFVVEKIEIRRFYKNYSLPDKLSFDEQFLNKSNKSDLLIFGGGGFFDYWVPNSVTGTTIDISESILEKLVVPTLFVSVGCLPHQIVPDGNIEKFHRFLGNLCSKENVRIAVRNDGSLDEINRLFGDEFTYKIKEIVDNGFFYEPNKLTNFRMIEEPYVAINSTLDQLSMHNKLIGKVDYDMFKSEMQQTLRRIIDETNYSIIFVPHIFKDIQAFVEILQEINDFHIRSRIKIAPYLQNDYGSNVLFSIYQNAFAVVGMRFHANVCSLAMNKNVIGLAALDRIINMYHSVGNDHRVITVNGNYSNSLFKKIFSNETINNRYVNDKKSETIKIYSKFLEDLNLLNC